MDERLHQCGWLFRGFPSGGGGQATGRAAPSEGLGGGGEGGLLGPRCIQSLSGIFPGVREGERRPRLSDRETAQIDER